VEGFLVNCLWDLAEVTVLNIRNSERNSVSVTHTGVRVLVLGDNVLMGE
jgi:hypothetical protein